MAETAITPTRAQDYPEWYQQVIKAADLAENSPVRGCMVIKPLGYGLWENIQRELDARIKATGHENAYFPLFIPVSFLEKEAAHIEGFAKECAVVTHSRLISKDGKLVPASPLEEPLIVRPTSEMIIGASFAKWVQSYRDLPLLINQWANVVRWEMRTRLFLRTAEFLWQEGHTAHASEKEAMEETMKMHEVYREFSENILAMPVIAGEKPAHERFPGAVRSFSIEAMMQDGKALQAGTSHYLGQNFSKAMSIQFQNEAGATELAYTTSWGVSTRLIGGVIMTHADDNGLRVPPRIAPKHVIVMAAGLKPENEVALKSYADSIRAELSEVRYHHYPLVVHVDNRDIRGGEKAWQWIKRGVPIRIEVGPRDMEAKVVTLLRRDKGAKDKITVPVAELAEKLPLILDEMQRAYFEEALALQQRMTRTDIKSLDELKAFFTPKNKDKPEIHGGFVLAKWCEDPASLAVLDELKVTVRCRPLAQSGSAGSCVLTGKPASVDYIFAKAY